MIGVDWGTSSFRAYRMREGRVIDRHVSRSGILAVAGRFPDTLRQAILPWLNAGESHVLLAGMIGSRQGWAEAPYLACPASVGALAGSLLPIPFEGAEVLVVPGVSAQGPSGVPEVMRGEETQILGALAQIGESGLVCLPGTHSKWAEVAGGRIESFATYLTGEAFAAFSSHTILGRMMKPDAPPDPAALRAGLSRSGEPGGVLNHLFGVRTLGLFNRLSEDSSASYLSGLLLGHEIRAALAVMKGSGPVLLIGEEKLCALYDSAIVFCGGTARIATGEPAAVGLAAIGKAAPWHRSSRQ